MFLTARHADLPCSASHISLYLFYTHSRQAVIWLSEHTPIIDKLDDVPTPQFFNHCDAPAAWKRRMQWWENAQRLH